MRRKRFEVHPDVQQPNDCSMAREFILSQPSPPLHPDEIKQFILDQHQPPLPLNADEVKQFILDQPEPPPEAGVNEEQAPT